jgi:cobalamin synthase
MKPEVWVPSLAALLAAFIPLIFSRLNGHSPSQNDTGALPAARSRVWWIATSGAVVAALAVWFSPTEWRWPVLGACVALTALVYAFIAWTAVRRTASRRA